MTGRLRRLALVALVPTLVDVLLLVALREGLGWILVVADLAAITAASALSWVLHRAVTFRSDPYVRWVRMPWAFVGVAATAALVDVVVLRGLHAVRGFDSAGGLVAAKAVSLAAAAAVRLALYRAVLLGAVRREMGERVERGPAPGDRRASIVIPALDEADRIAGTVAAVRAALADLDADGGVEIVVVDDGSRDRTADAALEAGADQVVVHPANRGKGAAVRSGVAAARGRTVAFTDADLSYSPDQLRRVIAAIEDGWDVAVGNRRHPGTTTAVGAGTVRDLGSRLINLVTLAVLLSHPRDTQCGLKGFRSDVARLVFGLGRIEGFAFDIEVLHLVERYGLSLTEVPVRLRSGERSTVHALRDGLQVLRDLWRIRRWSASGAYEAPGLPSERDPASRVAP